MGGGHGDGLDIRSVRAEIQDRTKRVTASVRDRSGLTKWRALSLLALGFTLSAMIVFLLPSLPGVLLGHYVPHTITGTALALLMVTSTVCDWAAARSGGFCPITLRRQTPKALVYSGRIDRGLGTFIWGLDTGSAFSTYRVSFGTFAVFGAGLLGFAPGWIGLAYAAGFLVPLISFIGSRPGSANSRTHGITTWLHRHLHKAQWVTGFVSLACSGATVASLISK